jgi:hypothetical protein
VALLLLTSCEDEVEEEPEMGLATLRPNGVSAYEAINPFFFTQPYAPTCYPNVDDDPDNDSSYIYSTGLFLGTAPITMALALGDIPGDLIETTQIKLRVRWFYDPMTWAYTVAGKYRLTSRNPNPDWAWYSDIMLSPISYPPQYAEYVIPVALSKADLNDLEWGWTVDTKASPAFGYKWAVTEVRVEVTYIKERLVGEVCVPGTFSTVLNLGGELPRCN